MFYFQGTGHTQFPYQKSTKNDKQAHKRPKLSLHISTTINSMRHDCAITFSPKTTS
jgi:hypothetical protein